jgi:UDP-N-acetylmuramate--alanine ligase
MTAAFHNFKRIHLVGIGGIGMSGIAEVLLTLGYAVSGSDLRPRPSPSASKSGRANFQGHRAENVHGAHVVVASSAISRDNPELLEAARLKIPSSRAPRCWPS